MNWREHHQKNAKRCFAAGSALLAAGAVTGAASWLLEDSGSLQPSILIIVQFWLAALILIGIGGSQRRKASMAQPSLASRSDESGEALLLPDREMMIKKLSGLQPIYRYFSVDGEALLEFRETSSRMYAWIGLTLDGLNTFLSRMLCAIGPSWKYRAAIQAKGRAKFGYSRLSSERREHRQLPAGYGQSAYRDQGQRRRNTCFRGQRRRARDFIHSHRWRRLGTAPLL